MAESNRLKRGVEFLERMFEGQPNTEHRVGYYRAQVSFWTGVFLFGGLLIVLVAGWGRTVALFWALSSFGVGAVVGFLFGIPKTVQGGQAEEIGGPGRPGQAGGPGRRRAGGRLPAGREHQPRRDL